MTQLSVTRSSCPWNRSLAALVAIAAFCLIGDGNDRRAVAIDGDAFAIEGGGFEKKSREVRSDSQVSFELEIQPILTSTGCNAGACHGKQRGQNGFQLSLLGFDSDFDFAAITKESRGRRIFPAAPEFSLLLQKATGELPHGGGKRFEKGSRSYRKILSWLEQGAQRKVAGEPQLLRIELNDGSRLLTPGESFDLAVTARYSDGTSRDVTTLAGFRSNEPAIVSVSDEGVITAGALPGETAIMARYRNQIEVCHVAIPLEKKIPSEYYKSLPRKNYIDDLVWKKLERLNIRASEPIDDATFLRRVFTDIIGRLPTSEEARQFLDASEPDKRSRLIDQLLQKPEYAEFAANKWADLLRTNPYRVGIKTTLNYDHWIRQQFRDNVPYDQFVRELVTSRGSTFRNGAVTMFRDRRSPEEVTTIVTQLFLGIRLECAKCHHHPFEKWSQDDFYSFAAFFSDVSRKGTGLSPPISGSEEIILETGTGKITHPVTGQILAPRPLYGALPTSQESGLSVSVSQKSANPTSAGPKSVNKKTGAASDWKSTYEKLQMDVPRSKRDQLATWLTSKQNDYFAQVQVNRVWADLMGRGIVEPIDDLRATNPPTNAKLLEALASDFRNHDFDQKHLIRTICNSHVYGLSSIPHPQNVSDRLNYSRHYRHRLRAEVLLDSLASITGVESRFSALPPGSTAKEIWTHRTDSLFLDTFGRPNPNEDPPCIRTSDLTVTQSLHLMNARDIHSRLLSDDGKAATLAKSELGAAEIATEIYLSIFSRRPDPEELEPAIDILTRSEAETSERRQVEVKNDDESNGKPIVTRKNIQDLMWAMINSPEFSIQN